MTFSHIPVSHAEILLPDWNQTKKLDLANEACRGRRQVQLCKKADRSLQLCVFYCTLFSKQQWSHPRWRNCSSSNDPMSVFHVVRVCNCTVTGNLNKVEQNLQLVWFPVPDSRFSCSDCCATLLLYWACRFLKYFHLGLLLSLWQIWQSPYLCRCSA